MNDNARRLDWFTDDELAEELNRRLCVTTDPLIDALRTHHPTMRSETGPFSGCRCGQVKLGQDVIAHVVAEIRAALDPT